MWKGEESQLKAAGLVIILWMFCSFYPCWFSFSFCLPFLSPLRHSLCIPSVSPSHTCFLYSLVSAVTTRLISHCWFCCLLPVFQCSWPPVPQVGFVCCKQWSHINTNLFKFYFFGKAGMFTCYLKCISGFVSTYNKESWWNLFYFWWFQIF